MSPEMNSVDDTNNSSSRTYKKTMDYVQKLLKLLGAGIFDPSYKLGLRFCIVQGITCSYIAAILYSVIVLWNESKLSVLESLSTIAAPSHVRKVFSHNIEK